MVYFWVCHTKICDNPRSVGHSDWTDAPCGQMMTDRWVCHYSSVGLPDLLPGFCPKLWVWPCPSCSEFSKTLARDTVQSGKSTHSANDWPACGLTIEKPPSRRVLLQSHITQTGWWFGCHFLFSHILGISSSQLTDSYFSEKWLNHQAVADWWHIALISPERLVRHPDGRGGVGVQLPVGWRM